MMSSIWSWNQQPWLKRQMSSSSVHCFLNLSRTSQEPPSCHQWLYAPRRSRCLSKIGRIMWLCAMLQSCLLRALYLKDWVSSCWHQRREKVVMETRVVISSHWEKGQCCEQQCRAGFKSLFYESSEQAVLNSKSGDIFDRATGNKQNNQKAVLASARAQQVEHPDFISGKMWDT